MNFANVITQQIADSLPTSMPANVQNASSAEIWHQRQLEGWRKVSITDNPPAGFRVDVYAVIEIDSEHCQLAIAHQVNIAEEAAALAAAELAAKEARRAAAKATLDSDPVLQTLLYGVIKCAVKSGLAANDAAAKQLLINYFDSLPL